MKTDYEKQASDFLNKTSVEFSIKFIENGFYFENDKETRDIYKFTIKRGDREFSGKFGNSTSNSGFKVKLPNGREKTIDIAPDKREYYLKPENSGKLRMLIKWNFFDALIAKDKIIKPKAPTNYDILACLTKYDVGTFNDFCSEFGYDTDSKTAEKTYNAVCDEFKNVQTIWNDSEIELLQEIQ